MNRRIGKFRKLEGLVTHMLLLMRKSSLKYVKISKKKQANSTLVCVLQNQIAQYCNTYKEK